MPATAWPLFFMFPLTCFRHRSRTSKAHGSVPGYGRWLSGLCTRSAYVQTTTAKDGMRAWTGRQSAPSCLCTSWLTCCTERPESQTSQWKCFVRHEAAKTWPEQIQCTCAAQTVGSMDEYRAGTRSVDGLLRTCWRVYLSVWLVCVTIDRVCRLTLYTIKTA